MMPSYFRYSREYGMSNANYTQRRQTVKHEELKSQIERSCKKTINDEILTATLSVNPEAYSLNLYNNAVYIELVSDHTTLGPKLITERRAIFKKKFRQLHVNNHLVLDLMAIPKPKCKVYKSVKKIKTTMTTKMWKKCQSMNKLKNTLK